MKTSTKIVLAVGLLALVGLAVAYPEYQRRSVAFYACADRSKSKLLELRSSGQRLFTDNDFFFVDKGPLNAEPDETRGYRAIVVYDIGYTPDRLVLICYVANGVVNSIEVVGKVNPRQ